MPKSITCTECLGAGRVCTICHQSTRVCHCVQIDDYVCVNGISMDGEVVFGQLERVECSVCDGTGQEDLRLDEARHYLRGAA